MHSLIQFGFIYGSVLMAFKSCSKTVVKLQIFVRAARNGLSFKKKKSDLQCYPLLVDFIILHSKTVSSVRIASLVYVSLYASTKTKSSSVS